MLPASKKSALYVSRTRVWSPRNTIDTLLLDGKTIANYVRGFGITGTTNASAWANRIGSAPALAKVDANGPTIEADGSLTFDGVAQYMQATFAAGQPTSVYFIATKTDATLGQTSFFDAKTAAGGLGFYGAGSANFYIYAGASLGASATPVGAGEKDVYVGVFNGAASVAGLNGTFTIGDAGSASFDGFTVGATGSGAQFTKMTVHEVAIRTVADSVATYTAISAAYKALYGTP